MNTRTHSSEAPSTLARVAALVAIACLVATAVWLGARDRTRGDSAADATTTADQPAATQPAVEQVAPEIAPTEGVVIPTGIDQVTGYPSKFPRTDLGAVALQIEVAKAQVGFDYDQAVTVAGLYATPEDQTVFEERARDAVALRRRQAGVARLGDVPAPAAYAVTPIAYTLEELDSDYYAVNLLSYVTRTTAGGKARDGLYAGTQLMAWVEVENGWDWRLVQGSPEDIAHLVHQGQPRAVAPGTPEFTKAGWVRINGAPQ